LVIRFLAAASHKVIMIGMSVLKKLALLAALVSFLALALAQGSGPSVKISPWGGCTRRREERGGAMGAAAWRNFSIGVGGQVLTVREQRSNRDAMAAPRAAPSTPPGDLKRLQRFQEFVSVHVHLGTGVDNVVTDNVPSPWVRVKVYRPLDPGVPLTLAGSAARSCGKLSKTAARCSN
jgi:hypothetical protein